MSNQDVLGQPSGDRRSGVVKGPERVKGIPDEIRIPGFAQLRPAAQKRALEDARARMDGFVAVELGRDRRRQRLFVAGAVTTLLCVVLGLWMEPYLLITAASTSISISALACSQIRTLTAIANWGKKPWQEERGLAHE